MIHVKDHKTRDMFSPFAHLGPKRLALLEKSWAHLFREEILHRLPAEKLFSFYDELKGRRTKELYAMLGLLILQQMQDMTDDETVHQFAFNIQWQYALNVTEATDFHAYVCPRTLWGLRDLVSRHQLEQALFENVTETLQRLFCLDASKQRLDSVHLFSNMRHLGRIRLFVATIRKFLVNLKRHHKALFEALGAELTDRYLSKKGESLFAAVKPSESANTLQKLGDDLFALVGRFGKLEDICSMSSYQLLTRLLREQCVVADTASCGKAVTVKPNKDVPSDSLQNPSDPDAGYSGHKGKGFQAQVMETCSSAEEKEQPNLITHFKVEAAHESDVHALLPAIKDARERDLAPTQVLADSLYGSDENIEKAAALGVEVVAPTMGKVKEKGLSLADFEFTDSNELLRCPAGHAPERDRVGKGGGHRVQFAKDLCDACEKQSDCPVIREKRHCTLSYDDKALRLARRRAIEKSCAFRDIYRLRAGIEATMSDLDRITGLKHLRVRGMRAVRYAATLKATGLNILRSTAFRSRRPKRNKGGDPSDSSPNGLVLVLKERCMSAAKFFRESLAMRFPRNHFPADFLTGVA